MYIIIYTYNVRNEYIGFSIYTSAGFDSVDLEEQDEDAG